MMAMRNISTTAICTMILELDFNFDMYKINLHKRTCNDMNRGRSTYHVNSCHTNHDDDGHAARQRPVEPLILREVGLLLPRHGVPQGHWGHCCELWPGTLLDRVGVRDQGHGSVNVEITVVVRVKV